MMSISHVGVSPSFCHIDLLDDKCLLNIFKYLPEWRDVLSFGQTCRRFHGLSSDWQGRVIPHFLNETDDPRIQSLSHEQKQKLAHCIEERLLSSEPLTPLFTQHERLTTESKKMIANDWFIYIPDKTKGQVQIVDLKTKIEKSFNVGDVIGDIRHCALIYAPEAHLLISQRDNTSIYSLKHFFDSDEPPECSERYFGRFRSIGVHSHRFAIAHPKTVQFVNQLYKKSISIIIPNVKSVSLNSTYLMLMTETSVKIWEVRKLDGAFISEFDEISPPDFDYHGTSIYFAKIYQNKVLIAQFPTAEELTMGVVIDLKSGTKLMDLRLPDEELWTGALACVDFCGDWAIAGSYDVFSWKLSSNEIVINESYARIDQIYALGRYVLCTSRQAIEIREFSKKAKVCRSRMANGRVTEENGLDAVSFFKLHGRYLLTEEECCPRKPGNMERVIRIFDLMEGPLENSSAFSLESALSTHTSNFDFSLRSAIRWLWRDAFHALRLAWPR